MRRTVLCLFDYAKAYDTFWRDELIYKMAQMKIPSMIIRWTQGWLTNRHNWVTFNNTRSSTKTFQQGLPQGAVMSPLLFLIYANDLSAECEPIESIKISMYADDVAVWAHEKSRDSLQSKIQIAADKVVQWSKKWKLSLSAGKCEVAFFSTNTHEAH